VKPKSRQPAEEDGEDWLLTFADVVTLLLTFFVLLYSTAETDQEKFKEISDSINKHVLHKEPSTAPIVATKVKSKTTNPDIDKAKSRIKKIINQKNMGNKITVEEHPKGLIIELASKSFFASGSGEVQATMVPVIKRLASSLRSIPHRTKHQIIVEGHTDDIPIKTNAFPSNWELSSKRAVSVLKILQKSGISSKKLSAVAYGETRPKAPNADRYGEPISRNQAKNRRVVINVDME
jgi:chemotaxis protein MotB